jgi:hypothetical protein
MDYIRRPTTNDPYHFHRLDNAPLIIDDRVNLDPVRRLTDFAKRAGKNRYMYISIKCECFRQTVTVIADPTLTGRESPRDQ